MIWKLRWWHSCVMLHSIHYSSVSPWNISICKTTWIINTSKMLKAAWTCDIGKWGGTGVVNADDDSHITAYKFHFSCLLPAHPSPLELCTPAAVFRVKCMDFGFPCQPWSAESWSVWSILFLIYNSNGWDSHCFTVSVCSFPYFHWKENKWMSFTPLSPLQWIPPPHWLEQKSE